MGIEPITVEIDPGNQLHQWESNPRLPTIGRIAYHLATLTVDDDVVVVVVVVVVGGVVAMVLIGLEVLSSVFPLLFC